jgi:hypothetical protein
MLAHYAGFVDLQELWLVGRDTQPEVSVHGCPDFGGVEMWGSLWWAMQSASQVWDIFLKEINVCALLTW